MAERVLSTADAERAIKEMQRIINGDLIDTIDNLNRQGQTLSDREVWDGRLAVEFRSGWKETYAALKKAQSELEELRGKVEQINQNIMTAGGNR